MVNAQETNMIRTFAQIVISGQLQPQWGEQALATQQVLDALLASARQEGSRVAINGNASSMMHASAP
jgi:hypothetical protein